MVAVVSEIRRTLVDVGFLVRFRLAALRGRGRGAAVAGLVSFVVVTVAAAVVPAFGTGAASSSTALDVGIFLPTAYVAFLATTTFAIIGAGGGRELLPREQAVAFPVSTTSDHVGALLMAPLNIAWLMQAWTILGMTAYVAGPRWSLAPIQLTVVLWLLTATCTAQAIAWGVEWVRRGRRGRALVRLLAVGVFTFGAFLVAFGQVSSALDRSPTLRVVLIAFSAGRNWGVWALGNSLLLIAGIAACVLGAALAYLVSRRPARDEMRSEGRIVAARPDPRSDLVALVRGDRASVWRSVPLRRGFVILALFPGLVAAGGHLDWNMLPVLPGLVAAGGALLFGVNAWCLDATGALWRDSLPVSPRLVFAARAYVLAEILVVATLLTLCVAGVRAPGLPTAAEVTAIVATAVVVTLQVVARSMHWSVRRAYFVDLRSPRGTPAPPLTMVGYSCYLAFTSTLTGLLFSLTAKLDNPAWAGLFAAPLILLALRRIVATARVWGYPEVRARVVTTVASR